MANERSCGLMRSTRRADAQEDGRWANNRVENNDPSFLRRELVMLRFRRMKTLQKFASVAWPSWRE